MDTQFQSVKNLIRAWDKGTKRQLLNSLLWEFDRITPAEFNAFLRARARGLSLSDFFNNNILINKEREITRESKTFREAFPDKNCEYLGDIAGYDLPGLIAEIKKSDFLTRNSNLSLQWFIENYNKVMAGAYRNFLKAEVKTNSALKKDFIKHDYNKDLFETSDLDKIEF